MFMLAWFIIIMFLVVSLPALCDFFPVLIDWLLPVLCLTVALSLVLWAVVYLFKYYFFTGM